MSSTKKEVGDGVADKNPPLSSGVAVAPSLRSDQALQPANAPAHTPLPWIVEEGFVSEILNKVRASNGSLVAVSQPGAIIEVEANAEFIVRACNSYYTLLEQNTELLEALRLLLYGAKIAVKKGLVQPQVNGGIVLAEAIIAKCEAQVA